MHKFSNSWSDFIAENYTIRLITEDTFKSAMKNGDKSIVLPGLELTTSRSIPVNTDIQVVCRYKNLLPYAILTFSNRKRL
jgi:hypothetical protein